jgi:hypothetical protein
MTAHDRMDHWPATCDTCGREDVLDTPTTRDLLASLHATRDADAKKRQEALLWAGGESRG